MYSHKIEINRTLVFEYWLDKRYRFTNGDIVFVLKFFIYFFFFVYFFFKYSSIVLVVDALENAQIYKTFTFYESILFTP